VASLAWHQLSWPAALPALPVVVSVAIITACAALILWFIKAVGSPHRQEVLAESSWREKERASRNVAAVAREHCGEAPWLYEVGGSGASSSWHLSSSHSLLLNGMSPSAWSTWGERALSIETQNRRIGVPARPRQRRGLLPPTSD
jgi:hypothetical protein